MNSEALWAFDEVRFDEWTSAADLVAPARPAFAFTKAERIRSATGRTVQHWAGRLAAKRAVLRLLELDQSEHLLGSVEILPRPAAACRGDAACRHGHPPVANLSGPAGRRARRTGLTGIEVSISHETGVAAAVAFAIPTPTLTTVDERKEARG